MDNLENVFHPLDSIYEDEGGAVYYEEREYKFYGKTRKDIFPVLDGDKLSKNIRALANKKKDIESEIDLSKYIIRDNLDCESLIFQKRFSLRYSIIEGESIFRSARFERYSSFYSAHFGGDSSFYSAHFEGNSYFDSAHFVGESYFDSAHFEGNSYFDSAHFEGNSGFHSARFEGNSSFDSARFEGNSSFYSAHFEGDSYFDSARFEGYSSFHSAHFGGYSSFDSARFEGESDFGYAHFEEECLFSKANFESESSFRSALFEKRLLFRNTKFKKMFIMYNCVFEEQAYFTNCQFLSDGLDFSFNQIEGRVEFSQMENEHYKKPDIAGKINIHSIILKEKGSLRFQNYPMEYVSFNESQIKKMDFLHVKWEKKVLHKKGLTERNLVLDDYNRINIPMTEALRQYRELRLYYEEEKDYIEAEAFYYSEMLSRLKIEKEKSKGRLFKSWSYIILALYKGLSDFGFSISRPLMGFVLSSAVVFPLLYGLSAICSGEYVWSPDLYASYKSYKTFLIYSLEAAIFKKPDILDGMKEVVLTPLVVGLQYLSGIIFSGLVIWGIRKRFRRQ